MDRQNLNVVFCGRHHSGTATLLGRIIQTVGGVDHRTIDALYVPHPNINLHQWVWGIWREFDANHRLLLQFHDLLLMKEYSTLAGLERVITGERQADLGVYVIDITEYEIAASQEGISRKFLAFVLCFEKIIIIINKMDTCDYSSEVYNRFVDTLSGYLIKAGVNVTKFTFVPVSSLYGDNIQEPSNNMPWFEGNPVIWTLEHAWPARKLSNMALRIPIRDAYGVQRSTCFCTGHVQTGVVEAGQQLHFGRCKVKAKISELAASHGGVPLDRVGPSSPVSFFAHPQDPRRMSRIGARDVASVGPCQSTLCFQALLLVLRRSDFRMSKGYRARLACHVEVMTCCITKIYSKKNVASNLIIRNPEYVQRNETAQVQVVPKRPIVLEKFTEFPKLGRFTISDNEGIVAVGIVEGVWGVNVISVLGPPRELGCGFQVASSVKPKLKNRIRHQRQKPVASDTVLSDRTFGYGVGAKVIRHNEGLSKSALVVDKVGPTKEFVDENTSPNNNRRSVNSSYKMSSNKGKSVLGNSDFDVNQLNQDVNLDSNDQGGWAFFSKKKKNKGANVAAAAAAIQAPKLNPWVQPAGRGVRPPTNDPAGGRGGAVNNNPAPTAIPPPLQSGWNWNSRPNNHPARRAVMGIPQPPAVEEDVDQSDVSDDEVLSDEYDSDEKPKSHEERKKNKWHAEFFICLDKLSVEQINEPDRQWHCPACKNGPGAIDWYKSLPSLVTHAKTKGTKRVKIHRDLAELLEEELRIRGALVVPAGESYGNWKGLNEVVKDKEIVWPPIVVIMNTKLELDEKDRWLGMGNQELLDYFGSYQAVRARHAYGPRGHRGMSLLIFETSAVGYTEAERLSKHFEDQGTDQDAWDHHPQLFYPGGKRQLYGYMATKRDMDIFNQHAQGKSKLKFEMVSYQEKVVDQLKQNKEEMDYQQEFFKDHLKVIQASRTEKEVHFDNQAYSAMDPEKRDEKLEEKKAFEKEKMAEMKTRHWREVPEMEAGFNTELNQLMAKYTPKL